MVKWECRDENGDVLWIGDYALSEARKGDYLKVDGKEYKVVKRIFSQENCDWAECLVGVESVDFGGME